MSKVLCIPKWDKTFENAQSRRINGPLNWVAMPTDQQSREYKRIIRSESGPSVFGAWCAIVELAARMPERGVLCDSDGPLDAEDIADETDFPVEIITHAISILTARRINWLREKDTDGSGAHSESTPSIDNESVPTVHNITGQNRTGPESRVRDASGELPHDSIQDDSDLAHLVRSVMECSDCHHFREQDVMNAIRIAQEGPARARAVQTFCADLANVTEQIPNAMGKLRGYMRNAEKYESDQTEETATREPIVIE